MAGEAAYKSEKRKDEGALPKLGEQKKAVSVQFANTKEQHAVGANPKRVAQKAPQGLSRQAQMAAMKHVQVSIKDDELTPVAVRPGGSEKQKLDLEVEEVKNLPDTVGKEKSQASDGVVKSAK